MIISNHRRVPKFQLQRKFSESIKGLGFGTLRNDKEMQSKRDT